MNISSTEYSSTVARAAANFVPGAIRQLPSLPIFLFTGNRDKIAEFNHFFENTRFHFLGTRDLEPALAARAKSEEPEESGETLLENSIIKSSFGRKLSAIATVADDTGFFVDALDGDPGVRAGRYAGEPCDYEANRQLVMKNLSGKTGKERGAAFRCMITLQWPDIEKPFEFLGECRGTVLDHKREGNQFGYDPIFVPDGYEQAFSEMDLELKNRISHRGLAFAKLHDFLARNIL